MREGPNGQVGMEAVSTRLSDGDWLYRLGPIRGEKPVRLLRESFRNFPSSRAGAAGLP